MTKTPKSNSAELTMQASRRHMLKLSAAFAATATAGSVVGFAAPAIAQTNRFLKPIVAGLNGREGDPSYNSIALIPKILKEKFDIEMDFVLHPSSILGGDMSLIDGVVTGFIDITSNATSAFTGYSNAWLHTELPYFINSEEAADEFFVSDLYKKSASQMESDMAVKVLPPTGAGGFRLLASSKNALHTPADLAGAKIRASGASPVLAEYITAWGGSPTPIPFMETYTALQQSVATGMHMQPIWMTVARFYEVLKHASEVKANYSWQMQILSADTFDSMPKPMQEAFMSAAKEAADIGLAEDRAIETQMKQGLIDNGMELYTPTPDELVQWQDAAEAVWEWAKINLPADMVAEADAFRKA